MNLHALNFGDLSMFGKNPEFFQHLVQLLLVGHGKNFLRSDLAVMKFNAAVGQFALALSLVKDGLFGPPPRGEGSALVLEQAQGQSSNLAMDLKDIQHSANAGGTAASAKSA